MIAKHYRLKENEVKKVLAKRKPFFSHHMVANVFPNNTSHARIGIVLSGKQTRGSVNRNTYRRLIYDTAGTYLTSIGYDIVFVCKKGIILDRKDETMRVSIERDILFLLQTIKKTSR